jgi:hypothetical protein
VKSLQLQITEFARTNRRHSRRSSLKSLLYGRETFVLRPFVEMGLIGSWCPNLGPTAEPQKSEKPKQGAKGAPRVQGVRNETEDPHAPLLTKRPDRKPPPALDPDFDGVLSSDDGLIPDISEINALLSKTD